MEFGFWCLRYAFTFVIFILGIKAPGISTVRDYYSRYSDTEVISQFIIGNGMNYDDDYVSMSDNEEERLKVKTFFQPFGGLLQSVEIKDDTVMSHNDFSTLGLELNRNLSYELYFMDQRMQYIFGSPDIIPRPVLTLKPNPGAVYLYLKAIRHEKLNQPNQPCNSSQDYDFTFCIEKKIITTVGCQPPWTRFIMEGHPLCDNLTKIHEYSDKVLEFYDMGKNDLLEETSCLLPCIFMEYKVSCLLGNR